MPEYISKELVLDIIGDLKDVTENKDVLFALNEIAAEIRSISRDDRCITLPYRVTPNSVLYLKRSGEVGFTTFCDKAEADKFIESELAMW